MSNPVLKPMGMAFLGFTAWTLGDACVRALNAYPAELIGFCASIFSIALLLVLSPYLGGIKRSFTMPHMGLQVLRGFFVAASSFLGLIAFMNLDLATAYALIFLSPFLAKVISTILTKEKISFQAWCATIVGFIGVLIVLRPGIIPLNIGTVSALGLTFFFSLGQVMTRYIGKNNQTLFAMSFFPYFFIVLGTAWPAWNFLQDGIVFEADFGLVVIEGFIAVIGMLAVSYGFTHAPTAYIAPIHYVQILWGALWGILFFGEFPDLWTIIGGCIIIMAGILLVRYSATAKPGCHQKVQ